MLVLVSSKLCCAGNLHSRLIGLASVSGQLAASQRLQHSQNSLAEYYIHNYYTILLGILSTANGIHHAVQSARILRQWFVFRLPIYQHILDPKRPYNQLSRWNKGTNLTR